VPTQHAIQPAFSRGEISPRLHARVDIDQWRTSLAECFNFVILRQGGARRRPGTKFIALAKNQGLADKIRLVPFIFSAEQSYVIELGHLYMRFYALGGRVETSPGTAYEVVTPWAGADIDDLQFAQSADVLYVTHGSYAPRKISRLAETNWTVSLVAFEDGPYQELDTSGTTLLPDATGSIVTSGTPSANSGTAANAFDGDVTTDWTSTPAGWLMYDFGVPSKIINGYAIRASRTALAVSDLTGSTTGGTPTTQTTNSQIPGGMRAPRSWTIQGSHNSSTWTVLDTKSGITGWGDGEVRYFTFRNEQAFRYYRLDITNNNSGTPPRSTSVSEWSMSGGGADAATITLTASSVAGINKGAGFQASDVGRHIRVLDEDANWHWLEITVRTSTTVVQAKMRSPPLPSVNSLSSWRLGAFSGSSGYPRRCAFFLSRLVYANTTDQPQTLWASETGAFDSFAVSSPGKPDDAITLTIAAAGEIEWLAEGAELQVGTVSAARAVGAANKNEGFSATNIQQAKPAHSGSDPVQPVLAGDIPIFVARFGKSLRELSYSFDANGYTAPDMSVLSEHLLRPGVKSLSYAQDPDALMWAGMKDGSLVGATYEKSQQMQAFHSHGLGGGGYVESQCVIPGQAGDELWLAVRRTRPDTSANVRTIERLSSGFEGGAQKDAVYLDCSTTYSGSAATGLTGLSYLNGFSVASLADGGTEAEMTIAGGVYTVPSGQAASAITIGFAYESRIETLPIAAGMGDGSGLGRKKRIKKILLNLLETGGVKVKAKSSGRYQDITLRSGADSMDAPTPIVTGDYDTRVDDQWSGRGVVQVLCDSPQPATIRAITVAYDGEP
jgi:hypothetical protein